MTGNIVLVTGATGQQGGATARHLLTAGWRVRALVRDTASPAATALATLGADLVRGDMTDRASLDAAVAGAYGVFSVQPAEPHEVEMGRAVADAAAAAGARHLVYASVGGADRSTGISHWMTKWEIEEHIRTLGLPYTMLRPVMFMENHASRSRYGVFGETALIRMIPPTATVQLIAADDIGAFAALAFTRPDDYRGLALEIAGDELTRDQLVTALQAAVERPIVTDPVPVPAEARARGERSFGGWQADIPALRRRHPGLMTFDTWLGRTGRAKLAALPA
ncbi:MAG TPA: NmrA/HSCARG family protein [Actinocatenispora sp.]